MPFLTTAMIMTAATAGPTGFCRFYDLNLVKLLAKITLDRLYILPPQPTFFCLLLLAQAGSGPFMV
jgi:hypothetical protein